MLTSLPCLAIFVCFIVDFFLGHPVLFILLIILSRFPLKRYLILLIGVVMVPGVATLGQRQVTMVINKGHFSVLLPTYWDPKVHKYPFFVRGNHFTNYAEK